MMYNDLKGFMDENAMQRMNMEKQGNMYINKNINHKTFLIIGIIAVIAFLAVFVYCLNVYNNIQNYVKMEATIIEVGYHRHADSDSNSHYIRLEYSYNDTYYNVEQTVLFIDNKKVGNKFTVYVNPDDPNEILDFYVIRTTVVIGIVMLIACIFCFKAYKMRKEKLKDLAI